MKMKRSDKNSKEKEEEEEEEEEDGNKVFESNKDFDNAGIFSLIFFTWLSPLLVYGYRNVLHPQHIGSTTRLSDPVQARERFEKAWNSITLSESKSISIEKRCFQAIVKAYGWHYVIMYMKYFVPAIFVIVISPFFLGAFLRSIQNPEAYALAPFWGIQSSYLLAFLFSFFQLLWSFSMNLGLGQSISLATAIRSSIVSSLQHKSMKLSSSAKSDGEMVNLLTSDAERVYYAFFFSQWLITSPALLIVTVFVLGVTNGALTGVFAFLAICILCPLQIYLGWKIGHSKSMMVGYTDRRVQISLEAINGIYVVKTCSWEDQVYEMVQTSRLTEVKFLRQVLFFLALLVFTTFIGMLLIGGACFGALYIEIGAFGTSQVYEILAFVNILNFPVLLLPKALSFFTQGQISMERVSRFLSLDDVIPISKDEDCPKELAFQFKDASFSFPRHSKNESSPVLKSLNLNIEKGKLYAIVGRVGSGKTALVKSLLGEMIQDSGRLLRSNCEGVGYASADPWIQNATLRKNIEFLHDHHGDDELFQRCCDAACLRQDIESLVAGVETEIGTAGINLSGGQKARVALARTIYHCEKSKTETVILDGSFSALDASTTVQIFDSVLLGMLKSRTRILVLNSHLDLLTHCDYVVIMDHGSIESVCTPKELESRSGKFGWILDASQSSKRLISLASTTSIGQQQKRQVEGNSSFQSSNNNLSMLIPKTEMKPEKKKNGRLYKKEERRIGALSSNVIISYADAAVSKRYRLITIISVFFIFGISQACKMVAEFWIGYMTFTSVPFLTGLGIYYALLGGSVLLGLVRSIYMIQLTTQASRNIHDNVIKSLLHAPLNLFFHITPAGLIANRLSTDIDRVDNTLADNLLDFFQTVFGVLGTLVACCIASPYVLIVIFVLLLMFLILANFYLQSSRELKRIEAISRTPMASLFAESLSGRETIRAFNGASVLLSKQDLANEKNTSLFFILNMTGRWLAVRIDSIVVLLQISISMLTAGITSSAQNSAIVGLSLVYSLQLMGVLQWLVRLVVELMNNFTAVERLEYLAKIEPERNYTTTADTTKQALIMKDGMGCDIVIKNLEMRYRPKLPLALKGLYLHIEKGSSVGLCGRSGSGKSSLISCLFRLVDKNPYLDSSTSSSYCISPESDIMIDGKSIYSMSLQSLRKLLALVPQTPVLFTGSLRFNLTLQLDKSSQISDAQIWDALEFVQLKKTVESLPNKLLFHVSDGGKQFSNGEAQLLCMARSVISNSPILLMDEASSNSDMKTDQMLQDQIRSFFGKKTIITIAHRLDTILDYDRIAVMENGNIVEFGSSDELVEKYPDGRFASLLRDSRQQQTSNKSEVLEQAI